MEKLKPQYKDQLPYFLDFISHCESEDISGADVDFYTYLIEGNRSL